MLTLEILIVLSELRDDSESDEELDEDKLLVKLLSSESYEDVL